MRAEAIARSYADTLLTLAQRNGGLPVAEQFLAAADEVAALMRSEPRIGVFLATPHITLDQKKDALRAALAGRVPELFLRFVLVVVDKRRQRLLGEIAEAYRERVDEMMGRVRVDVALSHQPDAALREEIRASLSARLGREVVPVFTVDPELLGGIVVRTGGRILDGSLQTRAADLRRRMMEARIPRAASAAV